MKKIAIVLVFLSMMYSCKNENTEEVKKESTTVNKIDDKDRAVIVKNDSVIQLTPPKMKTAQAQQFVDEYTQYLYFVYEVMQSKDMQRLEEATATSVEWTKKMNAFDQTLSPEDMAKWKEYRMMIQERLNLK